ncbi:MAG TPA: HAMP domain-containing sensor histidine kinase [Vineibacter sp.]|nr:HAMP domain-containing sensor histidine kinase [Vineibacter sp.]
MGGLGGEAGLGYCPSRMASTDTARPTSIVEPRRRWRGLGTGLSPRILALVVLAVMTAEVALFLPSIARFRLTWLEERIESGTLATLALDATPDNMVDERLARTLLNHARVDAVTVIEPGKPKRVLMPPGTPEAIGAVDLVNASVMELIWDALEAMARSGSYELRVGGRSSRMPSFQVYVYVDELPMRVAMYGYAQRILLLSIIIAAFTAGLLYVALRWLIVRPLQHVSAEMVAFRRNPEDETITPLPVRRADEIGIVDRELEIMQRELRSALLQKTRLAELGAAMSKINHDLRNMLATTQLLTDRLARSDDPKVRELAPIMFASIDRAVKLCADTLSYARGRPTPKLATFDLADLVDEVGVQLLEQGESADPNLLRDWRNDVDLTLAVMADRSLLFRVIFNLGRNAFEAGARGVTVRSERTAQAIVVDLADDGPGVPVHVEASLFRPFAAGGRPGGSGLGLAIARELVRAHGGDVTLAANGPGGATFRFTLPLRP